MSGASSSRCSAARRRRGHGRPAAAFSKIPSSTHPICLTSADGGQDAHRKAPPKRGLVPEER
jgi:hypothetical protein